MNNYHDDWNLLLYIKNVMPWLYNNLILSLDILRHDYLIAFKKKNQEHISLLPKYFQVNQWQLMKELHLIDPLNQKVILISLYFEEQCLDEDLSRGILIVLDNKDYEFMIVNDETLFVFNDLIDFLMTFINNIKQLKYSREVQNEQNNNREEQKGEN